MLMDNLEAEYLYLIRYAKQIFRRDFITNKGCETIKVYLKTYRNLAIVTMTNGIVIEIKTIM